MKGKSIFVEMRAKHFNTTFTLPCDCAIAKAVKEQLGVNDVEELIGQTRVGSNYYLHQRYTVDAFNMDKQKTIEAQPEDVIRVMELIPFANNDEDGEAGVLQQEYTN